MKCPERVTKVVTLVIGVGLALASTVSTGCGGAPRVSYVPVAGDIAATHKSESVEVLLDRAPDGPHVVTGTLFASSVDNPQSIALMREKAAAAGLDGIYWIDCTSTCSGHCTAKGYVYVNRKLGAQVAEIASRK